ncbi:MAG: PASTA domain-containing protein, partial [Clostridia bacterium]|nr:PASTA domain-containing protein [Clostridia bacterium]
LLVVGGAIWGFSRFWIKEEIPVPDITNLPAPDAQRILAEKNLKMAVQNEIFDAEVPKDHIISQDPLPDTMIKAGRTIQVVVSKGPQLVLVPNVIGSSQIIADVNITNADLTLGEVTQEYSSQYANGIVIDQYPKAGTEVPEKTAVNLVVSKGPEPQNVSMPALVGLDFKSAQARIQENGLVLGEISRQRSEVYPKDFVIEQDPIASKEIIQGTEVKLIVSDGPGPTSQSARVTVKLNETGEVKIQVRDVQGTRIAYQKYHEKGDVFVVNVSHYGQGIITVFINGKQVSEQVVPVEQ